MGLGETMILIKKAIEAAIDKGSLNDNEIFYEENK